MTLGEKLEALASGAKYDASCASSGVRRTGEGGLGNALPSGICHSWAGDGRCVSLLKILYSNVCRLDCAYCVNRVSNDIKRTSFTVDEIVRLTMDFYRRNYIEGLFLSSGIFSDPDIVMGKLIDAAKRLRTEENYHGYIHLKAIPGAGEKMLREAGLWADRLSANIELPCRESLAALAPQKSGDEILGAMRTLDHAMRENAEDRVKKMRVPPFAPAGQSTQLVVGASKDDDVKILTLSSALYGKLGLKRVYYSAFVPILRNPSDSQNPPPLLREHRLYQADWLLRFYRFSIHEILESTNSYLDTEIDPKSAWALRHPELFPVELSRASYAEIIRIPGIGLVGASKIIETRRSASLSFGTLRKIGIIMKRARYFVTVNGIRMDEFRDPSLLRLLLADRGNARIGPSRDSAGSATGAADTGKPMNSGRPPESAGKILHSPQFELSF